MRLMVRPAARNPIRECTLSRGQRIARISPEDWEVLYCKYLPMVRSFFASKGLASVDIDDLAQEVFGELAQDKKPEEPRTYLRVIARNVFCRHYRRQRAEQLALDTYRQRMGAADGGSAGQARHDGGSVPDAGSAPEQVLAALFARLPAKQTELMKLRFVEGLSVREVAQRMRCSADTARKRIQRAKLIVQALARE